MVVATVSMAYAIVFTLTLVKIVVLIYAQTSAPATGNALILAVAALVISLARTVQFLHAPL